MNHFILKHKQLSEVEAFVTVRNGMVETCKNLTQSGWLSISDIVGVSVDKLSEDFTVIDSEINFDLDGCRYKKDLLYNHFLDELYAKCNNIVGDFIQILSRHNVDIDFFAFTDAIEEYCNPAIMCDQQNIVFLRITGGNNMDNHLYMQLMQMNDMLYVRYTIRDGHPHSDWMIEPDLHKFADFILYNV